ncbi:MAG: phospholipase A [Muribaculaceae bacterium]|nr:phospholipase A [Muribaculaceae bacterium]
MRLFKRVILCVIVMLTTIVVNGQITSIGNAPFDSDSVRRAFDNQPHFSLYKDNYFIFGPSKITHPTARNTDVKFQLSISQRLTNSTLPWGTHLYLFYTQKCFWNILQESMPMTDLNFNPGIGLAKPLFVKNRYIGKIMLTLEHESNGKSQLDSRSWNKISFGANIMIDNNLIVHGKFWIPIIDGENNQDILNYSGLWQGGFTASTHDKRFGLSMMFTKRAGWNFNYNIVAELNYRVFKNENQYLFLQYYNGYGEGLLDYNEHHSALRLGIVIKPKFFSEY